MTGTTLHLRTQRDQPYGSSRHFCERCSAMVWEEVQGDATPDWTDDPEAWAASERNCSRSGLPDYPVEPVPCRFGCRAPAVAALDLSWKL